MEIAYDLATAGAVTSISVRSEASILITEKKYDQQFLSAPPTVAPVFSVLRPPLRPIWPHRSAGEVKFGRFHESPNQSFPSAAPRHPRLERKFPILPTQTQPTVGEREMASASEMQPLAPAGYRRAPEMKEKVDASAVDLEAGTGETLYPGISRGESALRWGFVRKVYGILAAQLLLTTAVSALTVLHPTLNAMLSDSAGLALVLAVLPFILMIPLYHYQHKHPHNFVFLGLFTLCLSFSIGVACANTQGKIVLEALVLTAGVVASLTAYAFWASKKGKEFGYLGPILSSALTILVLTSFLQIFFPLGPVSVALFGGLGALVFSGFILYDTENLIRRHTYDEYIWASVGLYLDILNLFLSILNMLRSMQSDN